MSDEFLLAWEDFQQNMATGFKQVLQNKEFVDVTLVSGDDVKINAHRIILSTGSGFFRYVLSENTHHHPIIYMRGVNYEILQALVDFLYLGHVKIQQHLLNSFMETALDLNVHGLKNPDTMNTLLPNLEINQDHHAKHDIVADSSFWDEFSMIPDLLQGDFKTHPKDIDTTDFSSTEDQNVSGKIHSLIDKFTGIKEEKKHKLGRKRGAIKVKRFKPSWLDMYFDSEKADTWLQADPTDETRGVCTVCPPKHGADSCSFNINDGRSAIQQHSSTEKHRQALV